jgi:hypothetical protein
MFAFISPALLAFALAAAMSRGGASWRKKKRRRFRVAFVPALTGA